MYHERQRWAFCGVHAVNNLLQKPAYDKDTFDAVCEDLAPSSIMNPHRSMWGIGNYDANVLMVILEQKQGLAVQWHDARQEMTLAVLQEYFSTTTTTTPDKEVAGIVVNLPSTSLWARYVTKGRHWFTLLWQPQQAQWINLDSNLKEPKVIGDMQACVDLLQEWRQQSCHILLVKTKAKETTETTR
ncbi:Josephin-2 [Seminavis robusta]|uniref:ubiquitinyl hydrolase 1 n=1 Tax=Seminavis robusta TaxID=568900 RepID=A0A9N8F457_9STRA|nr:Josephin-2 [Seminavis robusta]|eukprot:Sro3533_g349020.1 Josephin-2 (186) ;mRNA; f:3321-3878